MAIRFAREADLPEILAIYAPYVENTTVSFEYEVPTQQAFTQRFQAITRQFPWLVPATMRFVVRLIPSHTD